MLFVCELEFDGSICFHLRSQILKYFFQFQLNMSFKAGDFFFTVVAYLWVKITSWCTETEFWIEESFSSFCLVKTESTDYI